jgi:hypothetical protein
MRLASWMRFGSDESASGKAAGGCHIAPPISLHRCDALPPNDSMGHSLVYRSSKMLQYDRDGTSAHHTKSSAVA